MTIRVKLTIQYTMIITLVLLLFSISLYYFSASYRKSDYFGRLESRARTTARLLIETEEIDERLLGIIDRGTSALFNETVEVYDQNEQLLYKSGFNDPCPNLTEIKLLLVVDEVFKFKNDSDRKSVV